jgi:hypothetical protein
MLRTHPHAMAISPRGLVVAALMLAAAATSPALAETPSTPTGSISVAQVMDILDRASSERAALQLLQAYLGGVGEAAGVLVSATDQNGSRYASCDRSITLDEALVRDAIARAAPEKSNWTETPATPIIVNAMMQQAGCR